MIKGGAVSIINIASLGGLRCLPGMPAYCSSKRASLCSRSRLRWISVQPKSDVMPSVRRHKDGDAGGGTQPLTEVLGQIWRRFYVHIFDGPPERTANPLRSPAFAVTSPVTIQSL